MKRFEHKTPVPLQAGVIASVAAVFAADILAPLGVAVFFFYLVPVVLTVFAWRPLAPLVVAAVTSILILVDGLITPEGAIEGVARLNRVFAALTLWLVAAIGTQFIRNRLAVRKETWLQAGLAGLSRKIAGQQRQGQICENALSFLCEYLGAQAGAMFAGERGGFRLAATHAVRRGSVPERFEPGEGLLGQAAKDARTVVLPDVPDGYLATGSCLGAALPRHLVVAPVVFEDEVHAVVELGFFNKVQQSDRELLGRAESAIALALRAAAYRARLQELLEETQQQNEEVQAQSEELRVSNEELEEQSRSLRESQARLELQQTELEQINTRLEEQTQALERQKRDLLDATRELEAQRRLAADASRYKSEFLANMSHELRTPLNSALILAKLLAENRGGNLNEEQIRYARTIETAGNDLLALINDVLDLSKIEAGHMDVRPEPVDLRRLVDGLRETFQPAVAEKNLTLRTDIGEDVPGRLETDPQRLLQVLKNLLSNALKFTKAGEVALAVKRREDGWLAFTVSDTGIGIDPAQQRAIFEPFQQGDGTTSRKYGGTGLGLSISRQLVDLLGGRIELESQPGEGSTFTVSLPPVPAARPAAAPPAPPAPPAEWEAPRVETPAPRAETPPAPAPAEPAPRRGDGRLILVIEDDEPFTRILADLAHEMRFECLVAGTGEEGMALARRHLPDAVLLDIVLPDGSGLAVLERLKADAATRHIPVHVISGSDYTRTARAIGAAGYMLKPVKREELVEAFRKLDGILTRKVRRVLVVEDDPVQAEAMRELLGSRDVETVCVGTAAECLAELSRRTFDCVVLDLSLPDTSGFELLETLSAEADHPFPPVIVYTGRHLSQDEERELRRRSSSIIIKGAKSPERLLDEVTLFLHQVVAELPPEKQKMLEMAGSRDADLEGRLVLIAEDDVRNVFALTSLLEGRGVQVRIARNGREAIEELEKAAGEGREVDLVLMDIMMPEMDGLTAMREIRGRREWRKLPIIALTAKAMASDQRQCLEAGANDYLAKPLDVEKLLSLVRVWMPR